jgi:hypothetical protein
MSDARYHRAVQVVLVPIPAAGSPEPFPRRPPPRYPKQTHESWRPQRSIPSSSKAEALRRLLDAINRNDEAARAMLGWPRRLEMIVDHEITPACVTDGFLVRQ